MNAYFLKWNLKIHDTAKKIGDRWLKNKWNVDKCKEKKKRPYSRDTTEVIKPKRVENDEKLE